MTEKKATDKNVGKKKEKKKEKKEKNTLGIKEEKGKV